jgi:NAD+ diphosphatase
MTIPSTAGKTFPIKPLFVPSLQADASQQPASIWFIFDDKRNILCASETDRVSLPLLSFEEALPLLDGEVIFFGELEGFYCHAATCRTGEELTLTTGTELMGLRAFMTAAEAPLGGLAGRAIQLLEWDRHHRYCGRCGSQTINKENDRAKICPVCGLVNFPRLSPAVIMLVSRGEEALLSRSPHFKTGLYSVQAGFVEAGESLEETVHRELMEETGIQVKNLKYFGSQSWPFPNSLMIGFTAEYASGALEIDGLEIEDAAWFRYDKLPLIPDKLSIARRLIDGFVEKCFGV